ncbi:hypothetical protein PIB30_036474 [Stylosanthes scabra]|uniref:Uncharacterized protein n=1 Tax=Stylosanthes scabra TaxID=79078 RepID=A0ABU6WGW8_9FABA|nr:hypothetical protein [Stylosanthes scabra]
MVAETLFGGEALPKTKKDDFRNGTLGECVVYMSRRRWLLKWTVAGRRWAVNDLGAVKGAGAVKLRPWPLGGERERALIKGSYPIQVKVAVKSGYTLHSSSARTATPHQPVAPAAEALLACASFVREPATLSKSVTESKDTLPDIPAAQTATTDAASSSQHALAPQQRRTLATSEFLWA